METVLKAIADWIKGILTAGIMSNLSGLFDDVNTQVGNIAQQVGTKPSSFEPRVFVLSKFCGASLFFAPHHHFAFLISNFSFNRGFQT